jgi:hypothetical protein
MKRLQLQYFTCAALALVLFVGTSQVQAVTAQQIVDSVIDELDNASDYQGTVDIDWEDVSRDDMSGGDLKMKRTDSRPKFRFIDGTNYTWTHRTDGSTGYNYVISEVTYYHTLSQGISWYRDNEGSDLWDMEYFLGTESWTKADSNDTINSIECYKVYTTKDDSNYEVWIDTANMEKVIRVKATDENDSLQWQIDYSDYLDVESTALLPTTILMIHYDETETENARATCSFSDIDINESISDSYFTVEQNE